MVYNLYDTGIIGSKLISLFKSFKSFQVNLTELNVPNELPEETKVIYNNLILMGLSPVQEKSLESFQQEFYFLKISLRNSVEN